MGWGGGAPRPSEGGAKNGRRLALPSLGAKMPVVSCQAFAKEEPDCNDPGLEHICRVLILSKEHSKRIEQSCREGRHQKVRLIKNI